MEPTNKFRFQFKRWNKLSTTLAMVLGVVITAGCVVGQVRGGRFPAWNDIGLCASIPFGIYAVLAVFGYCLVRFCPITVSASGFRCINYWTIPRAVSWDRVRNAVPYRDFGLEYILCDVKGMWFGPLIPTWIEDWEGFRQVVLLYAGPAHPLTRALFPGADKE